MCGCWRALKSTSASGRFGDAFLAPSGVSFIPDFSASYLSAFIALAIETLAIELASYAR
jgi:hypothetical protein